jgi:hypothetical protein
VYLYYALDGRPTWFRAIWKVTDIARRTIAPLPFRLRKTASTGIAALIYWPLARFARLGEWIGAEVSHWPLGAYRRSSFYSMRTDALDRFGTRLEQRFTRAQIEQMMKSAGLSEIQFSDREPYWVAVGYKEGRVSGSSPSS